MKNPLPPLRAACIQYTASEDVAENLQFATNGLTAAASKGAGLAQLPEMANLIQPDKKRAREQLNKFSSDVFLEALQDIALQFRMWIHVGSLIMPKKKDFRNQGFMIDDQGNIRAKYTKIHLFDVDLPNGESYRESDHYRPGKQAIIVDTPWGGVGMAICFDLRFSTLYARLVENGARILTAPAAFTHTTGSAHWHTLVRARAIEFGAPMLAANQGGKHPVGIHTYGHSLIVDAWGEILAEGPAEGESCIVAEIDPAQSQKVRTMVPNLKLARAFKTVRKKD